MQHWKRIGLCSLGLFLFCSFFLSINSAGQTEAFLHSSTKAPSSWNVQHNVLSSSSLLITPSCGRYNIFKSNVNKMIWENRKKSYQKGRLYALDDKRKTVIPTEDEATAISTDEKELTLTEKVKNAGISGILAYALTELGFWLISLPSAIFYYHYQTNEWLNFTTSEDKVKVAAFSAAFVSFARLIVPLRLGLALALTPFINKTIVQPLQDRGFLLSKAENE